MGGAIVENPRRRKSISLIADKNSVLPMANKEEEKESSPAKEKKQPIIRVHDLKAKKEVKGGAHNGGNREKQPPAKTGEVDFMNWD